MGTDPVDVIKLFFLNRDAPATNRGFYYQYLCTLHKWLLAFVNGIETEIFTEVDEDIKEVGDDLVFTQIKSYVDSLNLNSPSVQSTLYNFYILFLKYKDSTENIQFVFQTNTGLKKGEALLKDWIKDSLLTDENIRLRVSTRLKEILTRQFKIHRDKVRSDTKKSESDKQAIAVAYKSVLAMLSDDSFSRFVSSLSWNFQSLNPHAEIAQVQGKIVSLLDRPKFKGFPPSLLVDRLFTEIHKKSMADNPADRKLTYTMMEAILESSLDTLESSVNKKLVRLLDPSYFELMTAVRRMDAEVKNVALQVIGLRSEVEVLKTAKPRTTSKELTFIPKLFPGDLIGRDQDVLAIQERLKGTEVLCINGDAGIGKSSVVAEYVQRAQGEFDHIVWVNGSGGFRNAFIFDDSLVKSLNPNLAKGLFDEILTGLQALPGTLLIVVDDLIPDSSEGIRGLLSRLRKPQAKILICTRERFPGIPSYEILPLSEALAFELARTLCPSRTDDQAEVLNFLHLVEFNTLMIELCATTIELSLDLTFARMVEILKEQDLDSDALQLDISTRFSGINTRLFSYLKKTFDTASLDDYEKTILELLAVLPSEFLIEDYVLAHGKPDYENNKVSLLNKLNVLNRKGWIRKNSDTVKMHKLTQLVLRYNYGSEFFLALFVSFLCHRLRESIYAVDFSRPGFMAMAESIVTAIPRNRRTKNTRQTLIMLELDLLEAYRQIGEEGTFTDRMVSLLPHAEEVLQDDEESLAFVYTNASMAFQIMGDHENAVRVAWRGVDIFEKFKDQKPANFFQALSILISLLLYGDPTHVPELIGKALEMHEKHPDADTHRIASFLNTIGGYFLTFNQFDDAERMFNRAIILYRKHHNKKYDYFLALSLSNLAMAKFHSGRLAEAVQIFMEAIGILKAKNVPDNPLLKQCYMMLMEIYRQLDNPEKAREYEGLS